jgi:hypothetical protein
MDTFKEKIKEFNSLSRNTEDHFKLCPRDKNSAYTHELKLCSCHPSVITCTVDNTSIHLIYRGPNSVYRIFGHDNDSLNSLLTLLHLHRDDSCNGLLEWELEDWVSAGFPCKMHEPQTPPLFPNLGLSPEDLWCIDEFPSRAAYI